MIIPVQLTLKEATVLELASSVLRLAKIDYKDAVQCEGERCRCN